MMMAKIEPMAPFVTRMFVFGSRLRFLYRGEKCFAIYSLRSGCPGKAVYWLFAPTEIVFIMFLIRNSGGDRLGVP